MNRRGVVNKIIEAYEAMISECMDHWNARLMTDFLKSDLELVIECVNKGSLTQGDIGDIIGQLKEMTPGYLSNYITANEDPNGYYSWLDC